jgi:PPOX class probable F420-dependent enzyme
MMRRMDERARRLLEGRNFANVSTIRADGSIHSVFVWVGLEGDRVALNSAEGRAWPRNLERDPRVTVLVADQEDPYSYVQVRGRVAETIGGDEAARHIDELSHKYKGHDYTGWTEGQVRVKFLVEPEQVVVAGG